MALSDRVVYYKSEKAIKVVELSSKEKVGFTTDNTKFIELMTSKLETMDSELREEELAILEDNYNANKKATTIDSVSIEETAKLVEPSNKVKLEDVETDNDTETEEPNIVAEHSLQPATTIEVQNVELVEVDLETEEQEGTAVYESTQLDEVEEEKSDNTSFIDEHKEPIENVSVDVDTEVLEQQAKLFSKEVSPTTFEVMRLIESPTFDEGLTVKIEDIALPEVFQNYKAVTKIKEEHTDETNGLLHILRKESVAELLNTMQDSSHREKLNILFNILCELPEDTATSKFAVNNLMQAMFLGINAEPVPFCTAVTNLVSKEKGVK